ncbi:PREDICTED: snRNA-activating protein complex subunit 4 [Lipotes vexillifer]|uniref:snRNA-activating protein complex subunit 4 n=1 Tax=Lipotes vexillifer TaxID=118797 RepID=A0A340XCC3_LIPVE|nr:PREDICTED: snRNA-activating protein complex subunit 4 [Lipotes vexillifer]
MDIDAERVRISKEIRELERILDPGSSSINVDTSESSLDSDSDADSLPDEDSDTAGPLPLEGERWGEASNDEDDPREKALPEDPETCLQLNMVYQEVIREKLAEVSLLLAQNREQQEEVMWELVGCKGSRVKDGRNQTSSLYMGHFMKPYFKDKVTGVGPPANEDTRERAAQGIKAFEELLVTKWKTWEKALLRRSVASDRLQRLLQPKLLKLEYLQQKQSSSASEAERQILDKQAREAEKEVRDINQLPEEALLGNRLDDHDWEKISNVNFEGSRGAQEIRSFWQNFEHPGINKQEWSAREVGQLQAIAAAHGHLHWQRIADELGTCRSAFQCLQMYQQHSPALKRREWTEEEDRVLTRLVQEMRVGSHIPYRRIVYYMEGRDSMQLIYRWTKSLDPSLKKGLWAPEEDAKLLRAVAKYGEQGWFKIREEVPGRSDAQCRDRYLKRLHFGLKKGRWNSKEEEKLVELIEKYGVGHWAKIASELPHRTGSQCLSKWKIMLRAAECRGSSASVLRAAGGCFHPKQQRRRRGRRPPRKVQWSSSSGDSSTASSGDSGDSEPEAALGALTGGQALLPAQHVVPDVDLWVPARQSARELWGGGPRSWPGPCGACPRPPDGSNTAQGGRWEACTTASAPAELAGQARAAFGTQSTSRRGVRCPCSTDACPSSSTGPARQGGDVHSGPLETALQALRPTWPLGARRSAPGRQDHPDAHHPSRLPSAPRSGTQQEWRMELRQPHLRSAAPGPTPGGGGGSGGARPCVQPLWHRTGQRRQGHALQRRLLEHQLLTAVSPWVGKVILPHTPRRPAVTHSRADGIRRQLQGAHLASTPVFTLFIQLFQIDTAGCMEVVRERKARPPTLFQAGARDSPLLQVPSSARNTPGCLLQSVPARGAAKKSTCHTGSGGPQACHAESTPRAAPPAPSGPRPKPKTVSQLLREKRLREARARKAAQGRAVLLPQVLVSSPVVFQPLAPQGPPVSRAVLSGPGGPVAAASSALGSWGSAVEERPLTLQAFALAPASTGALKAPAAPAASRAPGLGPGQVPVSCRPSNLGQSQAPATSRKQGVPEAPPFLTAAPSPVQLPVQPLSLTPALGTHTAASTPLPVTWVLTPQGLLSVPVKAMVGLPRPTGTPEPQGLSVTLLPSPTATQAGQGPRLPGQGRPWQPPTNTDTESDSASRTEPLTLPAHPTSQSPAEVDMAHGPGGCSPGEAQVAGGTCVPRTSSQATPLAHDSEADPPGTTSGPGEPRRPLGLEGPPPPWPRPEKSPLDLCLLSQEGEAAVREWLRGQRGVCVPPLGSRLSYQPPTLCSLRALSGLLLRKKALEHRAASLVPSGAAGALQASLGRVRKQLRDSPAYLLLRVRFLAAFALPALLATLSPRGVPTTLSVAMRSSPESDSDDSNPGQPELVAGQLADPASGLQVAATPVQGTPHPGQASALSCPDGPDELDVLQTRRARHARKRRKLEPSRPVQDPPEHGSPRGLGACPRLEGRAWRVTSDLLEAYGEARPLSSAWRCQDSWGLAY